jgi:predicted GTPase
MAARSRGEQGMVLIMGVTGAGKSYFINRLKDGSVVEGSSMDSCKFEQSFLLREFINRYF